MNENEKIENMEDVFSKEKLDFMLQSRLKPEFMRVMRANFDVKEILMISKKKDEKLETNTATIQKNVTKPGTVK